MGHCPPQCSPVTVVPRGLPPALFCSTNTARVETDWDKPPLEDDSIHQRGVLSLAVVANYPAVLPAGLPPSSGK